jgi:hypothetical protein
MYIFRLVGVLIMQVKTFKATAPVFARLNQFAIIVQTGTKKEISKALAVLKADALFAGKKGWQRAFAKLAVSFRGKPQFPVTHPIEPESQFSIFAMDGNVKLPFVAFSTLPGVTCPGAGDCLDWCYSFRAWRYPSAFARQCQNCWLMRFDQGAIFSALAAIKGNFTMRLYVDGDFSSVGDVSFWMGTLRRLPNIDAYGYSKSFAELLAYDGLIFRDWPTNYMLNISSGHNADEATVEQVKALPITRGTFSAVKVDHKPEHGSARTNAAIRVAAASLTTKVFPCPGKCGSCTGKGHACGLPQMKGVSIVIAIH